ncbi:MAG: ATP-dependent DNA helicase RecG [Alphaproteobacteria bacterium]|nr:ATP-dependent DNA helicase RecG [Alphaproteobacteria bacterium]
MRPPELFPLFAPVSSLPGVGPKLEKLFATLAGPRVLDLLFHLPTGLIDRRARPKLAEAVAGGIVTVEVTVEAHRPARRQGLPYVVRCADGTGFVDLVFFNARPDWLAEALPVGQVRIVSGRLDEWQGRLQITHPDHVLALEQRDRLPLLEPVYRLTEGLRPANVRKALAGALGRVKPLAEWLDPALLRRERWPGWAEAVKAAHHPEDEAALAPEHPARRRLGYDELLANQLALALVRLHMKRMPGRPLIGDGGLRRAVLAALPFKLTPSQTRAIAEIDADMASTTRMLRLLQGDVGSGKTLVALMAMLRAAEAGAQAALMAPTEILARQHFATLEPLCKAAGLRIGLLTGREKGAAREAVLADLKSGALPLLIGTHALFQEQVAFHDLALAVIDEQHRFGVHQRLLLAAKGVAVDVLVMTATPIPRTLLLTAWGDMDISRLPEKPPGRKPVDTRTIPMTRAEEVIAAVGRALAKGARVYWVCPLVAESEKADLVAAEARYAALKEHFGEAVALVHGQMKAPARDAAMAAFASGRKALLVATTVIEVGVNVPEATVMVIEQAERFGLAQLHQLRGRIGRGAERSTCLLLYGAALTDTGRQRLAILRETEDGFRIADEDLRLRGAGEVLGTRQSGLPEFRLADAAAHADLLAVARDDARLVLARDPDLSATPRGRALRLLLHLFERAAAMETLQAG